MIELKSRILYQATEVAISIVTKEQTQEKSRYRHCISLNS